MRYLYSDTDWPQFQWDMETLAGPLASARYKQGLLLGKMKALGFTLRAEANLKTLIDACGIFERGKAGGRSTSYALADESG